MLILKPVIRDSSHIFKIPNPKSQSHMCLAIPMKIISRDGDTGLVEISNVKRTVSLSLVDAGIGDYVLVHAGVAISKIDNNDADETVAAINDFLSE